MIGDQLRQDVTFALRTLSRSRGFTLVATVMLSLAIGANGAIFGLLNGVLRTPPTGVERSSSVVWVSHARRFASVPVAYFRELRAASTSAVDLAGSISTSAGVAVDGEPVRVTAQLVSANFFSVLGVGSSAGRLFLADEDREETAGTRAVVVLSHEFWESRFNADRSVIGKTITVNASPFVVIGVAARGFVGVRIDAPASIWVPMAMRSLVRGWDEPRLVGRMRDGMVASQAEAALAVAAAQLRADPRFARIGFTPKVTRLAGWLRVDEIASAMPIIAIGWLIAAIVLAVVAANVANLTLVRAIGRRREMAVRVALGGARWRVMRVLLTESVVLALGAGVLGILFAYWGAALLRARFSDVLAPFSVAPDLVTIALTLLLAVAVGGLFGAAPAWRASRADVFRVIKGDHVSWLRRGKLQATLVVVQVSLSVVLVVVAGLFVRRLATLGDVQPGFDAEHTVTFSFDPFALRYSEEARTALYDDMATRLSAMPGVASVTVPTFVPLGGGAILAGAFAPGSGVELNTSAGRMAVMGVGPSYFATLGTTLIEGRDLTERDMTSRERVAVVSESFARRWWPNERALGKRFGIDTTAAIIEVVGVARDAAFSRIDDRPFPHAYVPYTQGANLPETHVVVRTRDKPSALIPAIRAELRAIDPSLPLFNVRTLDDAIAAEMAIHRAIARLLGGFGSLALVFASLGLYGVVAFAVASRTREIGIRVALGAHPGSVVGLFVREGVTLSAIGVVVGAVVSAGGVWVLMSAVEGLHPRDPWLVIGVALVLTTTAGLASWLSARRAGRVDAIVALRAD